MDAFYVMLLVTLAFLIAIGKHWDSGSLWVIVLLLVGFGVAAGATAHHGLKKAVSGTGLIVAYE
jgi:hypothetical protein